LKSKYSKYVKKFTTMLSNNDPEEGRSLPDETLELPPELDDDEDEVDENLNVVPPQQ
jgi:hypothetical protein